MSSASASPAPGSTPLARMRARARRRRFCGAPLIFAACSNAGEVTDNAGDGDQVQGSGGKAEDDSVGGSPPNASGGSGDDCVADDCPAAGGMGGGGPSSGGAPPSGSGGAAATGGMTLGGMGGLGGQEECSIPTPPANAGLGFDLTDVREYQRLGNYSGVPLHLGHLDGNEYLDVVLPLTQGGRIAQLFGEPGATLADATEIVIENANSVVLHELTGDAHVDMLVLSAASDGTTTRLYPGQGTGIWGAPLEFYELDTYRRAPMFADVVGDDQVDAVISKSRLGFTDGVTILERTGATSFTEFAEIGLSGKDSVPVLADFNGDGLLDVVAVGVNGAKDNLDVAFGKNDKTFQPITTVDLNTLVEFYVSQAVEISTGDVNGDDRDDLLIRDDQGANLWLGSDTGVPTFSKRFAVSGIGESFLVDADDDDHLDIVITADERSLISFYYGASDGTFSDPVEWSTGHNAYRLQFGDLENDGDTDVVVSSSNIYVMEQVSPRVYDAQKVLVQTSNPRGVFVDRFTGQDLDVVVLSGVTVRLLEGDGTGEFEEGTPVDVGAVLQSGAGLFANDDEHRDLIVGHAEGTTLYLGDGLGGFSTSTSFAEVLTVVVDFDGDGHDDFFAKSAGTLSWFEGDGLGGFNQHSLGIPSNVVSVFVDDFTGDDSLDLALTNWDDFDVDVYEGDGSGAVTHAGSTTISQEPLGGIAGDFTGDCESDLIVAIYGYNSSRLLTNQLNGTFIESIAAPTSYMSQVLRADFDGDGWNDFLHIAHGNAYGIFGFNNGTGHAEGTGFTRANLQTGGGLNQADVGDVDGDGLVDLILSNGSNRLVTIALNTTP